MKAGGVAGDRFDATGLLVREGGGFLLRRDAGGDYRLILDRVPVDQVGKRVRVIGRMLSDGVVEAEGVQPDRAGP